MSMQSQNRQTLFYRDHKIFLPYKEFAYKKTKDNYKLEDYISSIKTSFLIAYMQICR